MPRQTLRIPVVPKTTMVIRGPSPTPYKSDKEVPWSYESTVYVNGLKQECESLTSQGLAISNIGGTGGINRSGRIFGSEPQKKNDVVVENKNDTFEKDKGKAVVEANQEQEPPSKNFINQEVEEFL